MQTQVIDSFPDNCNPFHHDSFRMGTRLGSNCVVMHENFPDDPCGYLVIVNTVTGERLRVTLDDTIRTMA